MLVQAAVTLGTISVQKLIIDDVFLAEQYDKLPGVITLFVVLFVAFTLLWVGVATLLGKCISSVQVILSNKLLSYMQNIPMKVFQKERIASYVYYMTHDCWNVTFLLAQQMTRTIQHLCYVVLLFVIMGVMSPYVLLSAVILGVFYILLSKYFAPRLKQATSEMYEHKSKLTVHIEEGISATREVIAYDRQEWENGKYNTLFQTYFDKVMREGKIVNRQLLSSEPVKWGINVAILGIGGYGVIHGSISLGTFVVVYQFTAQLMNSFQNLFNNFMNVSGRMASAERLRILLEGEQIEQGQHSLNEPIGSIQLDQVSFAYSDEAGTVLNSLNMNIPIGSKVAIVGTSGGGKSTVAQLLIRFFEPTGGTIRVNGIDLNDIQREDWTRKTTIVFQEPFLFPDTIRSNLLLGLEGITEEQLIDCCRKARILDYIQTLEKGFDEEIGERGITLSGGQRQRLALARAFLRDSEILILDEATSALDLETERQVQQQLDESRLGKTTILIAHRLSTVRNADVIFVMDGGRVVETGSHESLMQGNTVYKQLVMKQTEDERQAV
jgi:ABC-type multidrug transport system fused ATPase/permease subunit